MGMLRHIPAIMSSLFLVVDPALTAEEAPSGFSVDNLEFAAPFCEKIPTLQEVSGAELKYTTRYLSAKTAASLGINVVSAAGSRDHLVIVTDYKRSKSCTPKDNAFDIDYGQQIQVVIELLDYSGNAAVNLPIVAAQGTLERKSQYFYLYKNGLSNPKIDELIAETSGKSFDVEGYGVYQRLMPELIRLMSDKGTTLSVQMLGLTPKSNSPTFHTASATTHGLAQIARGKDCQDATRRFAADAARAAVVTSTYTAIVGNCGATPPTELQKATAKDMLGGVEVK